MVITWICFITFLYIGVMFVCFQEAGTIPFLNDCWNRSLNKGIVSKQCASKKHYVGYQDQQIYSSQILKEDSTLHPV